jgi:predicted DNA-binding transcriptional regulator AlpA
MKNNYRNYDELPLVLNAQAISDVLGISRTNAYGLFNMAGFPTIKIGARKMVARDKFIEWLSNASKKIN